MLQSVAAIIDEKGNVQLLEKVNMKGTHRAILTILDVTLENGNETAFLSENALAKDWNRPEEDEAWKNL